MEQEGALLRDVLGSLTTSQLREELEKRSKEFEDFGRELRPDSPSEAILAKNPGASAAGGAFRLPPPIIETPPQEMDPPP